VVVVVTVDVAVDVVLDPVNVDVALAVVAVSVAVLAVLVVSVSVNTVTVSVPVVIVVVVGVVTVGVAVVVDNVDDVIDVSVVVLGRTSIGCIIVLAAGWFRTMKPTRKPTANMSMITVPTRTRRLPKIAKRLGGFGCGSGFFASDPNERKTRRVGRFSSWGSCLGEYRPD